jgi:RNA-directed DNA polymerase
VCAKQQEDFLGFSYGFRPGRSQQDALDALWVGIVRKNGWSSLSSIGSEIRIVRLIQKWLKAGVMEQGQWCEMKEGSPQGSVITPLTQKVIWSACVD